MGEYYIFFFQVPERKTEHIYDRMLFCFSQYEVINESVRTAQNEKDEVCLHKSLLLLVQSLEGKGANLQVLDILQR